MIAFVTALHCEAHPIVKALGLARDQDHFGREVFRSHEAALVVSGVGKLKSAIATTYLLTSLKSEKPTAIFNIGIAGSPTIPVGDLRFINKLTDASTERSFYPDILLKHGEIECSLATYDTPLFSIDSHTVASECVDMEGSGFFEAALSFLPPSRIGVMKVISDNLVKERLSKQVVSRLVSQHLPGMLAIAKNYRAMTEAIENPISLRDETVIKKVAHQLKLTRYQSLELAKMARRFKVRTRGTLEALLPFTSIACASKTESKINFEKLRTLLSS